MRYRIVLFILLIFLVFSSVPSWSGGTTEEPAQALEIWDFKYNDARTRSVYSSIDESFTEVNSRVIFSHIGIDEEKYVPAIRAALLAGTAPDIFIVHPGTEFIEFQSYLAPLDDFITESGLKFRDGALTPCTDSSGSLKAIPMSFQGMGWYYNKDLFLKAGLDPNNPPTNWDDFLVACRILREHGITPIASGNNRPLTTDFIRRSLVAAFFDEEEIISFFKQGRGLTTDGFRLIMNFCLTLRRENYLDPEGIYRPYFNHVPDSFSSGECAMTIGLLSDIAHWQYYSNKVGADKLGYFPNLEHPQMKNPGAQLLQSAGILLCVNKDSPNKEIAYRYLEHIYSEESTKILIGKLGMLVPLRDLYLPTEEYPVLADIETALDNPGVDVEQYTKSAVLRDTLYRYDSLLLNSMELSLDQYLALLFDNLKLF